MQIYKYGKGAIICKENKYYMKAVKDWDAFINRKNLYEALLQDLDGATVLQDDILPKIDLPPIGTQEIWASGVTYMRSKQARMEESKKAGGGSFYDKVYDAERPELFF